MPRKKKNFEDSITELVGLVNELEAGNLPLNDIMDKYKKSTELIKFCRTQLDDAEKTFCELSSIDKTGKKTLIDAADMVTSDEK